jgi:Gas vesicle synthesis protein GvpL/GvpF
VIYVYAIHDADAPPSPPSARGLGGARLHTTAAGGIAATFSRHRTLQPRSTPKMLWSHEAVVRQLMGRVAVLPLRFGTVLPDVAALRAVLVERRDALAEGLERVRGRVELSVRVLGQPPREPAREEVTGRAYLMARREAHHRSERTAGEVHEPLAALARDARLRAPAPAPAILAAAYLVDRPAVEAFKARVVALAAARDDLSIVGTGPWPPYSFVPDLAP